MTRIFLVFAIFSLLFSCRPAKKIQTAISKRDTTVIVSIPPAVDDVGNNNVTNKPNDTLQRYRDLYRQIRNSYIDFKTLKAKVKVNFTGYDGKSYNFNADVWMYKDSIVWINVNALLGKDVMRVMLTKDSVKLLDKINKTYTARSLDYLQELTNLPLTLRRVQNLIMGNPIFFDSTLTSYSSGNGVFSFISNGPIFKNFLTFHENDKTLEHMKLDDVNITRSRTAELSYFDYDTKSGFPFATGRIISVSEKKHLDITLNFKKYDFNVDVSFPFRVPEDYERL